MLGLEERGGPSLVAAKPAPRLPARGDHDRKAEHAPIKRLPRSGCRRAQSRLSLCQCLASRRDGGKAALRLGGLGLQGKPPMNTMDGMQTTEYAHRRRCGNGQKINIICKHYDKYAAVAAI